MIEINDECMSLTLSGETLATGRFSQHTAAHGNGAWIVSVRPARLFSRNQAITALTLAERLAVGYGDDDKAGSGTELSSRYRDKTRCPPYSRCENFLLRGRTAGYPP